MNIAFNLVLHTLFSVSWSLIAILQVVEVPLNYKDPIFWLFCSLGVIISLTMDASDKHSKIKINLQYVVYSLAVSLCFSLLLVEAKRYGSIDGFMFYFLTVALSTFSPSVVNVLKKTIPVVVSNGINDLIKKAFHSFGQYLINKSKGNDKQ